MKSPPLPSLRSLPAVAALTAALVSACGGRVPAMGPDRASGQSGLMGGTFAGKNKCDPKSHDRPFVIEWDATDMSQFEAVSANDIVFVKYEGCDLKVIDSCRNDSIRGQLGSYRAVDWTSGSVERIDIRDEGELYAKLPLGASTLAPRVSGGETFAMEYFVAGTRTATRPSQHRGDIAKMRGCAGVTHFVYAYNLGAFALGSTKRRESEVQVSAGAIGGGASSKFASSAEKKGGKLDACRGDSATEVAGCKTPIRLTLRPIEDGASDDTLAGSAAESPEAKNLAGKIQRERTASDQADQLLESANEKALHKDGAGCMSDLDAHDKLAGASAKLSTTPGAKAAYARVRCLMLTGTCDAGRELSRKNLEKMGSPAKSIDMMVESEVVSSCTNESAMKPRELLIRAVKQLRDGSYATEKGDPKACRAAYDTIQKLKGSVDLRGGDPDLLMLPTTLAERAHECFARAGDCAGAARVYREQSRRKVDEAAARAAVASRHPECK